MATSPQARTALYRFYDEDERLLYVGITDDIDTRWSAHSTNKHWWSNVARKDIEWHDDRFAAARAERDAIVGETPLYNVVHSPDRQARPRVKLDIQRPHGPAPAARWYAKVIEELSRQGKSKTWLEKESDVTRATLSNWAKQPRSPHSGKVLAVADALGINHDEALRLAGIIADPMIEFDGETFNLSAVPASELLAELARRLPD